MLITDAILIKWLRHVPLTIIFVLIAAIFLADLFIPGVMLGVLYIIPFSLATRSGLRDRSFILLALLMIFLIYLDHLWEVHVYPAAPEDSWADFNRGLAAIAICVNSGIILLLRNGKRIFRRSSPERAVKIWRAIVGDLNAGETVLRWMAALLTLAIFAIDLVDPVSLNTPILYIVPLAFIVLINRPVMLWRIVVLMLGFSAFGYYFSAGDFGSAQQAHLIIANRLLAGVGLAIAAVVLHAWARFLLEPPATGIAS
jgi:hypothetical protein